LAARGIYETDIGPLRVSAGRPVRGDVSCVAAQGRNRPIQRSFHRLERKTVIFERKGGRGAFVRRGWPQ